MCIRDRARGQAWGIYGCALAYKYTGRKEYIDIFKNVSDYFLRHLPEDMVPYWDLEFTSGDEPRDSSSASIAACGMLEMAKMCIRDSYIVGGGSNADYLNRLTADVTGKQVYAGPGEATAIGNIAVQMIADGVLKNLQDVYKRQVKKELEDDVSFAELCEMAEREVIDSIVDCNDESFLAPEMCRRDR